MMIITVSKSRLGGILVLSLVVIIIAIILSISPKNESYILLFLNSSNAQDQVEIFDIGKGETIRVVKTNKIIIEEFTKFIQGIDDIYVKVKAFPERGYIIKVPFNNEVNLNNQYLFDCGIKSVDKIFIILPEKDTPYIMLLDNKDRPFFYNFKGEINLLINELNFIPLIK